MKRENHLLSEFYENISDILKIMHRKLMQKINYFILVVN